MNTHRHESAAVRPVDPAPILVALESVSTWETRGLADLVPPATLAEARGHRDDLARLLHREREAAADFLVALADFDRRRGWERLGHASLFAFLTRELGLSSGAAQLRLSAARLLPRFPAVEDALRGGRLCISAVGQLARVLTPANEAAVLPRFFGRSAREALELAASILPCPNPPRREVVTLLPVAVRRSMEPGPAQLPPAGTLDFEARPATSAVPVAPATMASPMPHTASPVPHTVEAARAQDGGGSALHTHEVDPVPGAPGHTGAAASSWPAATRPQIEPLTAELRRLHLTVSARFVEKMSAARAGLSHALPGATTEQVLEAALDLLLERQARRKALVKRPRSVVSSPASEAIGTPISDPTSSRASAPISAPVSAPVSVSVSAQASGKASGKASVSASASPSAPTAHPTAEPALDSASSPASTVASTPTSESPLAAARGRAATDLRRSRFIPAAVERAVRLRDGDRCSFPLDAGGVCGSTWQVELDHLVPLAFDGPTTVANLRCACRAHNRSAAEAALGPVMAAQRRRSRA
jgi:5-methylcytosine-specific restriction endonuclease McrA